MRVFNLTSSEKIYKKKPIPPNGGSVDFPTLVFVPDRDRALESKRVLAFGALPDWFRKEQDLKRAQQVVVKKAAPAVVERPTVKAAPPEVEEAMAEAAEPDVQEAPSDKSFGQKNSFQGPGKRR